MTTPVWAGPGEFCFVWSFPFFLFPEVWCPFAAACIGCSLLVPLCPVASLSHHPQPSFLPGALSRILSLLFEARLSLASWEMYMGHKNADSFLMSRVFFPALPILVDRLFGTRNLDWKSLLLNIQQSIFVIGFHFSVAVKGFILLGFFPLLFYFENFQTYYKNWRMEQWILEYSTPSLMMVNILPHIWLCLISSPCPLLSDY